MLRKIFDRVVVVAETLGHSTELHWHPFRVNGGHNASEILDTSSTTSRFTFKQVLAALWWGLIAPIAVMVGWMFGVHALGAGKSVVLFGLPLWGIASLSLLALWLRRAGIGARDLGFAPPRRSWWHLLWAVPVSMAGSALVAASVGTALGMTKSSNSSQALLDDLGVNDVMIAMSALTVCLVAPLAEEIIFRGVLLGWLRQSLHPVAAVVTSAVIFGLCHISPQIMLYVIPSGMCLAAARVWFASTRVSFVMHVINNTLVTMVALTARG